MKNILLIQSSPRGSESLSRKVALSVVNDLRARYPGPNVVVRDLAENPPPHAGGAFVSALQTPPDRLTKEQSEATALSESLIAELSAADVLVLGVPMHSGFRGK